MPLTTLILMAAAAGAGLLVWGLWAERRPRTPQPDSVIRPIEPPAVAAPRRSLSVRLHHAISNHPDPLVAIFKTVFWLAMPFTLVDHLSDVQSSNMARTTWALTIIPHEVGHFVCMPFGWVLHFAGGSIWQVLLYVLLGLYAVIFRRQVWLALVFWMIGGHSLINLSVYIADAAERDLPLIFGIDKSHHDWWNLLNHYNALEHDDLIAAITRNAGVVIVMLAVIAGVITAWWQPRRWTVTPEMLSESQLRELDQMLPRRRH